MSLIIRGDPGAEKKKQFPGESLEPQTELTRARRWRKFVGRLAPLVRLEERKGRRCLKKVRIRRLASAFTVGRFSLLKSAATAGAGYYSAPVAPGKIVIDPMS